MISTTDSTSASPTKCWSLSATDSGYYTVSSTETGAVVYEGNIHRKPPVKSVSVSITEIKEQSESYKKQYKKLLVAYYNSLLVELCRLYKSPVVKNYLITRIVVCRKCFMRLRTFKNLRFA